VGTRLSLARHTDKDIFSSRVEVSATGPFASSELLVGGVDDALTNRESARRIVSVAASRVKKLLHPFGSVIESRSQDRVNYDQQ
jgi:hypothetical protein